MVVGGSENATEYPSCFVARMSVCLYSSCLGFGSFVYIFLIPYPGWISNEIRFIPAKGTYDAWMEWINGPPTSESLDSGKNPGVTQALDGGNNSPWKYASGPWLDVVIARHLKVYISRYLVSDIMVGIVTTYSSNNSQALKICIFDLTQFHGEGLRRIVRDPVWLTILLFKCNVHNANPITFNCKLVTPSEVIAPGASHFG